MSVNELRAGLARIAETVVPGEDPYERLMRHARRRRRYRWAGAGALLAGLLATVLVVPATGVGGLPTWLRDPAGGSGYPVTSDWVWRLLDSPTRGSLGADRPLVDELTRVFDQDRDRVGMSRALPTVKVLFADDTAGVRTVVVAYHSDTAAALVSRTGPVRAAPRQLVRAGGVSNLPVSPFSVLGDSIHGTTWLLGLAPAGCTVTAAQSATVDADGAVRRTWQSVPTPGYLLLTEERIRGWWRVECDGAIREQGPVGFRVGEFTSGSGPAQGDELRAAEQAAVASYQVLAEGAGLPAEPAPVRRWSGRIPGEGIPASIAGPASGIGPYVLQLGTTPKALLATAGPDDTRPDDTETLAASRADWALVATAVSTSPGLVAVRVPARSGGHAVLTDQLLVAPASGEAAEVEAVGTGGRSTAPVDNGFAILTVPMGADVTLRALDANGNLLAAQRLREPAAGERIFNEELISAW
ncbi:hypothetical protein ONA70_09540 [Micromonospora yasonensis]|uniref:hypothetical protein n=1 Tax=Micromonospora yasonensis TaxID=1128667 RepID=UPI0022306386|nr:hypothetical protein [Micromonospora yasonensis]MCW3840338.1 hypothetical protein [Micromonospora yasonensis]